MRKLWFILSLLLSVSAFAQPFYQWKVPLTGCHSTETDGFPTAHLWIPEGCEMVKAVVLAQQNMTEERILKMASCRERLTAMGVAEVWVGPAFSQDWSPLTECQAVFEQMMRDLAETSGHAELAKAPIVPLGHSAQATSPWNFAAWNPDRTLCILSFHSDAPRTNLCGYGRENVEWGRTRNIDGIPGLMVEGEYEWWEARVNPALAFRMMYPESCISFLCDTGRGHFDCSERTALYLARFIEMSLEKRLQPDGSLLRISPKDGWLAERFRSGIPDTDGADKGKQATVTDYSALPPQQEINWAEVGCVWAPETVYDYEAGKFLVHFTTREGNGKNRIFCVYMNDDFTAMDGRPMPLFEAPERRYNVIDSDIIHVGDLYHLFFVSHEHGATPVHATSRRILGPYEIDTLYNDNEKGGHEAPNCWQRIGEEKYILMFDNFSMRPHNFGFVETTDFRTFTPIGHFDEQGSPMRRTNFAEQKHGAVIQITKKEAKRMEKFWNSIQ